MDNQNVSKLAGVVKVTDLPVEDEKVYENFGPLNIT